MTADELHQLAGPLLGRIGWPERINKDDLSVFHVYGGYWQAVEVEIAACVIRCHVEDWLIEHLEEPAWGPTFGEFRVTDWKQDRDRYTVAIGATLLHALIAAATAVLDKQGASA